MASIKINNLQLAGSDLFNDSESYLNELTDSELATNKGGDTTVGAIFVASVISWEGHRRGWWTHNNFTPIKW